MANEENGCCLVADVAVEAVHPDEKDGAPPQVDALHTAHSTHLVDDVPVDVVPHHHTI